MQATEGSLGDKSHPLKNVEGHNTSFIRVTDKSNSVFLEFSPMMREKDFEEALSNMFDVAQAIRNKSPRRLITLDLTVYIDYKWDVVLKELFIRSEELTKISNLNFQMSGFSLMMLYDLFILYKKHPKPQDLPFVLMECSAAHSESRSILKQFKKSEGEFGIAFLKKLVFTGNDLAGKTLNPIR